MGGNKFPGDISRGYLHALKTVDPLDTSGGPKCQDLSANYCLHKQIVTMSNKAGLV